MSLDESAHVDTAPKRRSARGLVVATGFVVVTVLAVIGLAMIGTSRDDPRAASQSTPADVGENPGQPIVPDEQAPTKTPNDLAVEAAEARYREYLHVESEVAQSGYRSSAPYDTISVSPERVNLELVFRAAQESGARAIGEPTVASLTATTVDLQPEPGGYPKVVLHACLDVSSVNVVDVTGKSLVTSDRVNRTASTVTMYKYEPGTQGAEQGGWYVYEATSTGEAC